MNRFSLYVAIVYGAITAVVIAIVAGILSGFGALFNIDSACTVLKLPFGFFPQFIATSTISGSSIQIFPLACSPVYFWQIAAGFLIQTIVFGLIIYIIAKVWKKLFS